MPWLRLTLRTDTGHADKVSDALEQAGAQAITMVDAEDQPLFEPLPGEIPLWAKLEITGLFEADIDSAALNEQLAKKLPGEIMASQRLEPLEDKDWSRVWMDDYHPMQFGEKIWIVPSWCEPPRTDAVNILLDPGLAFGTGTHPTTSLCLQWLDGQSLVGKQVLDYGCGSGILAIAAAKLGAKKVTAIDIDPQALQATRNNAERNEVSDLISTHLPIDLPEAGFDMLLANILAGPLAELADMLCLALRPGGTLVLSGILAEQADDVARAYRRHCNISDPVQQGDWVRLSGSKHQAIT